MFLPDGATAEKTRLEEKQRSARKERRRRKEEWKPAYVVLLRAIIVARASPRLWWPYESLQFWKDLLKLICL